MGEYQVSAATGRQQPSQAENNQSRRAALSNSCWRIAVLTAAGAIGFAARADAADFWSDYDPAFSQAMPIMPQRARKAHRPSAKTKAPAWQAAKPQGPLIIAISISKQIMKIYDANGLFAETPISTGMRGHSTPMGAFSVIQKQKLHHSNIYSGAPMPYMQRITWSGIAIHAGVLPGYPASHGCIRMPTAFAIKMYGWTRMGARVVVTPGEITPASFSHPLLVTRKLDPQPVAADAPPDKAADADETSKPAILQAKLELRSTVGHPDVSRPATTYAPPASASPSEQTRTADASRAGSTGAAPRTMSDAAPDDPGSPQLAEAVATTGSAPSRIADIAAVNRLQGGRPRQGNAHGAGAEPAAGAKSHRSDIGVGEPQGCQTLCAAEFRAAVRRSHWYRGERPAVGNARVHGRGRQERSHRSALVGDLAADPGTPRGATKTSGNRGDGRWRTRSTPGRRHFRTVRPRPWIASAFPPTRWRESPKVYRPAVRLSFPIKASPRVKPATERTSSFPYAKFRRGARPFPRGTLVDIPFAPTSSPWRS